MSVRVYREEDVVIAWAVWNQLVLDRGSANPEGEFIDALRDREAAGEVVYRCTKCGKWSHAQRKPSSHERVITEGEPAEHNGYEGTTARAVAFASGYSAEDILEESEGYASIITRRNEHGDAEPDDQWNPGRVTVRCGPFETYVAIREVRDGG